MKGRISNVGKTCFSLFLKGFLSPAAVARTSPRFACKQGSSMFFCSDTRSLSISEAKKLLRVAGLDALKKSLEADAHEFISLKDLLNLCRTSGLARSDNEAENLARALDEAGVVLIFRDKVYLHPSKIAELVTNALPLALAPEDDPRKEEFEKLKKEKEEIDKLAHKHVRHMLWAGLGGLSLQLALFFRLTFWEFSWDVMEPIAFFGTSGGLVIGYSYFLITSRNPSYHDVRNSLYLSRQRKLYKKRNFDIDRFLELQKQSQISFCKRET